MDFKKMSSLFTFRERGESSEDAFNRATVIAWFSVFSSLWCLFFAGFYHYVGAHTSSVFTAVMSVPFLFTPLILKAGKSVFVAGNWVVACGCIVLAFNAWFSGGLYAPPVNWFLICPLVAALMVGISSGIFWGAVMLSIVAIMFALEKSGYAFPVEFHEGFYSLTYFITVLGGLLFTLLTALLYDMHIRTNINQIRNSRDELSKEILLRAAIEEKLKKSQQRFRLAVYGSHDGLWDWDLVSGEVWFSPRVYEMFGLRQEDLPREKNTWIEYVHRRDREKLKGLVEGGAPVVSSIDEEVRIKKTEGGYLWVRFKGQAFKNAAGKTVRYAGAVTDISDRKKGEEELRQKTEELKRSNQELEQFGYVTSHDLREPLRKINGFVRLLEQDYRGKLDSNADDYIEYIVGGVKRMDSLITDLLRYSRAGRTELQLEEADFTGMVMDAMSNLSQVISETGAEVRWDPLPVLPVHRPLMVQMIQNLIENSIKYRTEETPRIFIHAEKENGEWLFSFKDNGIGFDPKFSERIFVVFQRLHTQSEFPGTGIGLALCKKIAEKHNGRLWAVSKPGKGSTFFFTLPELPSSEESGDSAAKAA